MSSAEEERRIRYDRQVRLWGSGVQQRLHSTVLIVSPGAPYYADEALKNLVLAGIGKIRIMEEEENKGNTQSFFNQSVVALSSLDSNNTSSSSPSSKSEALVAGLRKLNNLVDCQIFSSSSEQHQKDLYENRKDACVIALIDSTSKEEESKILEKITKVTTIDIICNIRVLTKSFAFCDFSSTNNHSNTTCSSSEDAAVASSSSSSCFPDNSSYLDEPWTISSPHPPISVLLKKACSLVMENNKKKNQNEAESTTSFETFLTELENDKLTSEALNYSDSEIVEKVAAECLFSNSSSSNDDNNSVWSCSCTLNAVLGAVLAQQVLSHSCQVEPAVNQAANNPAGAQPRPARWLFCSENPHVECLTGN